MSTLLQDPRLPDGCTLADIDGPQCEAESYYCAYCGEHHRGSPVLTAGRFTYLPQSYCAKGCAVEAQSIVDDLERKLREGRAA